MKFIEIQTEGYDDDDNPTQSNMLLSVNSIVGVEVRGRARRPGEERVLTPYIRTQDGSGHYCFNLSYEELRRRLMTSSNVIGTGGTGV